MKSSRQLLRVARASTLRRQSPTSSLSIARLIPASTATSAIAAYSPISFQAPAFSTAVVRAKGLQPDSSDPQPPKTEPSHGHHSTAGAAQISDAEYHELADQYLNSLVLAMEELTEKNTDGVEAEFSAGVLTITHPANGTYVLNKQPPNRQIWLSSPISGPKRYDWVISSESQSHKEDSTIDVGDDGATGGKWIYLRDGSSLSEILKNELGVAVASASGGGDDSEGRGLS